MNYPSNLRYTKEHEWADLISPNQARIGITHHAQNSLGDIVFLELPKVGRELKDHETFGVVESIKAVSDLFSPLSGKVVQINDGLMTDPGKINLAPHDEWMIIIESSDLQKQFETLMTADQYTAFTQNS